MPGSVQRRGKHFSVVIDLGVDPVTGKRRQVRRAFHGNKKEAEAYLVQLLSERNNGIDVPAARAGSVGAYLKTWLHDYARTNVSPATYHRYDSIVHNQLIPSLGAIALGQLRPQHIQHSYSEALRSGRKNGTGGLSPRSVVQQHRILRKALQHAVQWQIINRNPADSVQPPRVARMERDSLDPGQLQDVLRAAESSRHYALVFMAAATGMRRGELLGLRWNDVDLDHGTASISQTIIWLPKQGFIAGPPKTHRSSRAVAISPATVAVLREHRVGQLEERVKAGPLWEDHGLVFSTPIGTPIDPSNLRLAWRRITEAAGVSSLRFHDLRHVHASLLLAQGVHPKIVSERLGHSGIGITMDTYTHVLPTLQKEAAELFDVMMGEEKAQ